MLYARIDGFDIHQIDGIFYLSLPDGDPMTREPYMSLAHLIQAYCDWDQDHRYSDVWRQINESRNPWYFRSYCAEYCNDCGSTLSRWFQLERVTIRRHPHREAYCCRCGKEFIGWEWNAIISERLPVS
mgnify:FL=1